ncbi:MAG: peptidoglycan DD-metalloendopeptidase family protein [Alphaproteobacteria bacterium]
MDNLLKRFSLSNLKSAIFRNLKSSTRFGETSTFSKNLNAFSNNLRLLLKERRFLYFTKRGPIEVVFNLKHYLSAFLIFILFLFKMLQFIFFGVSSFFSYLVYKNTEINSQSFTESEIQALKNIAKQKATTEQNYNSEKVEIIIKKEDEFNQVKNNHDNLENKLREKLSNLRRLFASIKINFPDDINYSDEVKFEQFSKLANPEMIAIEHTVENKNHISTKRKEKNKSFAYKKLPVIPFVAPRTKKLKIINFTKKIDSEIQQLLSVFEKLKLSPESIDIHRIDNLLKENINVGDNDELLDYTSIRFQILEDLKNAIIYVPLKPPMQYYYVSSPYGYRIHPKSKRKQMHHGIDMAGTWQEEVRAPADGFVSFSGRNGSFGKTIKIIHKHGVSTLYGHLHKLSVKKGAQVTEGQVIGKMGSTGRAVGAHLHYEIKINGKSTNPYDFISFGRELLSSSILKR